MAGSNGIILTGGYVGTSPSEPSPAARLRTDRWNESEFRNYGHS
jgi:hypothetical protein